MIASPPLKTTQVLEQPNQPDYSDAPTLLKEWAGAQGKNLVLQNAHADNVARLHAYGMTLLWVDDIPETLDGFEGEYRKTAIRGARDLGFEVRDGNFRKGDCALYVQSEERREAMELEAYERFRMQDLGSLEAARREIEETRGKPGWQVAIPDTVAHTVHDHVAFGVPDEILSAGKQGGPVTRKRGG